MRGGMEATVGPLPRPREAVPSRFASPGGAGNPSRKTSVLVPEGKHRAFLVRGFSIYHAPDTEGQPTSGAFLFAEHHIVELKGLNPRQTTLRGRGWLRNRCVSESCVYTGQHRRRKRFGRNSLRKRTVVSFFMAILSFRRTSPSLIRRWPFDTTLAQASDAANHCFREYRL